MVRIIKPNKIFEKKTLSLKQFYQKRNEIVIWHKMGGLGDVLMQRMLIDDFKSIIPDASITFACLPEYLVAAEDHPYIKKVIDSRTINPNDYIVCYDLCVTIADRYENTHAPCLEHRSDIWAESCGVTLKSHDMHFNLDQKLIESYKKKIQKEGKKTIIFAPYSKMAVKTLTPNQINAIVEATKDFNLVGIHNKEIPELSKNNIQVIQNASLKEWMYYIAAADYVISVDTAAFHMAGGLKKPLMGIFTFADGKIYGKYFDFVLVQKHRDNGDWDCGPCFKYASCPKCPKALKPCLTEISPTLLIDGINRLFEKFPLV